MLHACLAMPDNKPIQAAIVYTDTAWQKAALPLDQLAANLSSQFREIVLTDYTETELLEVDPQLVVLSPFTLPGNLTAEQLEDKIRHWRDITQQVYRDNLLHHSGEGRNQRPWDRGRPALDEGQRPSLPGWPSLPG